MKVLEAVVQAGGVIRLEGLPFKPGSRIEVRLNEMEIPKSPEEWREHVRKHYGSLSHTDFDVPEDSLPSEIEPL